MENKQQNRISICALVVSIISLLVTIIMSYNQYKENIQAVVETTNITSIDVNSRIVNCQAEIIVANTSHSTTSLIRSECYKMYPGFFAPGPKKLKYSLDPNLPITLFQGGAEKITVKCQYPLDDNELSAIKNGKNVSTALSDHIISIRLYSANNHEFGTNVRFNDITN